MSHSPQIDLKGKISLKSFLIIPFLLQIFAAVGLTGWLSLRNGQQAVDDLARRLMGEVGHRIDQHLDTYLQTPIQLAQTNVEAVNMGLLNLQDLPKAEQYFWKQLQFFPQVSYIAYALTDGQYAGSGRWLEGQGVTLDERSAKTQWKLHAYKATSQGQRQKLVLVDPYDPLKDDWYADTARTKQLGWTKITPEPGAAPYIAASANMPIFDRNHRFLGVFGVDLTLSQIRDFLQNLKVSPSGKVFIIEKDGLLIADSSPNQPFKVIDQTVERVSIVESADPLIRSTALSLQQQFGGFDRIQTPQTIKLQLQQNQQHFVQVRPWRDPHGLNWTVVMVVPESDFMSQINANTRTTIILCMVALAVATMLGLYTTQKIAQPILRLTRASQAIAAGDLSQTVEPRSVIELRTLAKGFNFMVEQLRVSFDRLSQSANQDSLTGLFNRGALRSQLQEAISGPAYLLSPGSNADAQSLFAVLFLDLDDFKLINDSLGHLVGDLLLIEVAQRLKRCVRDTDAIARFGGDEFVILLNPIDGLSDATQIAERISQEFHQPFALESQEVFMGVSIGIVVSTMATSTPDSLLRSADSALSAAKRNGKNGYAVFDVAMYTTAVQRLTLETDLRRAMERQELRVYYQPILRCSTQEICGFESLLRWQHPTHGLVHPGEFVAIAEETGLIVNIGWWILEQSCDQLRTWKAQFACAQDLTMSVNLSIKQFLQPNFLEQVENILSRTHIAPQSLRLEITESMLMQHHVVTHTKLQQLRHLGIQLSIDDFGTGYSSLSYLHQFPLDTLKIDRSFIAPLSQPQNNPAIVRGIIDLAHHLGLTVVAEGVEQIEQLQALQSLGCEAFQGYLCSKPVPHSEISNLLNKWALSPKMLKC